ncbi:hypothetical protein O0L34_g14607 [Tuta absoluta]|nr:hypothetical protein O0L34_g14607 [Tuta absoluta]
MFSLYILLFFGTSHVHAWTYTTVSTTTDGRPCLADCLQGSCIVDWMDNRRNCSTNKDNFIAPKFRTSEVNHKNNQYCLSNCGFFGYEYEWCVISADKKWDYCNSGDDHVSVYKRKCKEHCDKRGENYYWCYVEGGSWHHCAPPREKPHKRLRRKRYAV